MNSRNKQTKQFVLGQILLWASCWSISLAGVSWAQQETASTALSGQPTNHTATELKTLVQTSDRNGAAMHRRLVEYTYLQRRVIREPGPKGKVIQESREYEAYPVRFAGRHQHVISLVKKDGVPVSAAQLEQNRQLAVREMEQADVQEPRPKQATDVSDKYISVGIGISATGEGIWLGVSQFLRQCQFDAPRLTQLDGRETLALALHSCEVPPANTREHFMRQLAGVVWIDAAEKVVARLEAWPIANTLSPVEILAARPAAECIVYEQRRLGEGMWAPRRIRLNGLGQGRRFNGVDKDMLFEFVEYRRFDTEVKEKEIAPPVRPPLS